MLSTLDMLYIALALGFLVLVGFMSYTLYELAQTIKSVKAVVEDVEDIAGDVKSVKNSLKFGIGSVIGTILKKRR